MPQSLSKTEATTQKASTRKSARRKAQANCDTRNLQRPPINQYQYQPTQNLNTTNASLKQNRTIDHAMHAPPLVNRNGAIMSGGGLAANEREEQTGVVSGTVPLRDDESSGAAAAGRRGSRSSFSAKCKKYNTGHFLATGPSFSSLASSGSTIILNRHHNFEDEDDGSEVNVHSKSDDEYVMPLKDGEGEGEGGGGDYGGDGGSGPNPSSGIGNMRRVPRTNSYYHRAGMTPRLDDMHFLANAPSFSSVATTATNITDARLTSMASLANTSFASRNGLTAAAMSMASTSNLHNDPLFALLNSQGAAGISRTISTATSTSSAARSTRSNSSLPGGIVRPLGTGNIFLQQDDPEYQNLLTSIATSTVVVGRQPNTGDRCGRHPTTSAADTSRLQQQQQQQQQQVASSSSCGMLSLHRRRSSSALGSSQPSSTRRVASSSSLRRSSSTSAGSILRRGRYSSGFLASVREDQEESCNGAQDNNHNATFNNNSVKFTAPTIHHIGGEGQSDHQHLEDKEQTIENSGDFDDDEQIPECILAAFAGETPSSDPQGGRRPSTCSSLSDQEQSVQDKQPKGDDMKKRSEKPLQIPQEVTAVGRYYEDDELDEYLFTGIESLQMDDEDNAAGAKLGTTASSHKSSGHASSRRYQSAESMSSISTLESTGKRSVISQPPAR